MEDNGKAGGRERGVPFGAELRRLRDAAGLTQEELATRAGLTAKAVSILERGLRKRPYPHTVRSLADALGLSEADRASLLAAVPGRGGVTSPDARAPVFALPVPLATLVGREREIGEIDGLLGEGSLRLLTLTGAGGIGKTSLGVQAAKSAAKRFPDGVAFVALAPLGDASLVMPTVSQVLGLRAAADVPSLEAVREYLRDKGFLLLLDNFEHVVEAAPEVADLLGPCPGLTVLATSRVSLRVRGEREYPVSSLAVSDPSLSLGAEEVAATPAVRLFVERARAVVPSFELTEANAAAVAAICWRLDGLPLAIELAAAQSRFLGPTALLARLDRALEAGGARDLPERQRTMRNTIDWSHDLLSRPERRLFERLSVFAGGFTLEAAEEVGAFAAGDVSMLLGDLVEQSLVVAEEDSESGMRYRMLEPIRHYAAERLGEGGEETEIRRRHALWYTWFAERADAELAGPDQGGWLDRLEAEHDNLRAALRWSLDGNEPEDGLRLAAALWRMWNARGYMREGRDWLEKALSSADDGPSAARAKALNVAGAIAYQQGDVGAARELFEKSIGVSRKLGDEGYFSRTACNLANIMLDLGEYDRARDLFEQCLLIDRKLGEKSRLAYSLGGLADVYYSTGDLDKSADYYGRSLRLHRELDDRRSVALTLHNMGEISLKQDGPNAAENLYRESLEMAREIDDKWLIVQMLPGLASLVARQGHQERAVSVLAAADALRREIGFEFQADALANQERTIEQARNALPAIRFETAQRKGNAMSLEEVANYVLHGVNMRG
jgi:predicted ATPase/DNA-binding XRE family transcriptional regulator